VLNKSEEFDVYLFGGSTPVDFDSDRSSAVAGVVPVPTICAIVIRRGSIPPEYVAIRNYQSHGETILSFPAQRLSWVQVANCVFALKNRLRSCTVRNRGESDLFSREYSSLYTQTPSSDWKQDQFGKLDVRHANFEYSPDDTNSEDTLISEEFNKGFDKLEDFIPDFLERHDLGEEHCDGVKQAIRYAFVKARGEKQAKIDMLGSKYDPSVLENMKVVKIYPRNNFIKDHQKVVYVNEYYGNAYKVV